VFGQKLEGQAVAESCYNIGPDVDKLCGRSSKGLRVAVMALASSPSSASLKQ
jgi:hypothetical protein